MKKNIISKVVCFSLMLLFLCMDNVLGSVTYNGVQVSISGSYTDYSNAPMYANSNPSFVSGVRISLVTTSGRTVSSKDYLNQNLINFGNLVFLPGTCNKLGYSSGSCTYNQNNWGEHGKYSSISSIQNVFVNSGLAVDIQGAISSGNLSTQKMFNGMLQNAGEEKIKNVINKIMNDAGVNDNINNYKLPNGSYDLFIEWEPLSDLSVKSVNGTVYRYIGTTYELTNFVDNIDVLVIGACETGTAYCNFGRAFGKALGCSVFLDPNSDMGNVVNNNIDPPKRGLFQQTSYFGGKLNLDMWNSQSCNDSTTSRSLKNSALSYNSNSGVGLVWVGELINPTNPSCNDIYSYYGGKYSSRSPYQQIHINKASTFSFLEFNRYWKNTNPNFTGIDVNWFKTNCPCEYPDCELSIGYNCTPNYNISSCTDQGNKTLSYSDSTDWERCIFTDTNNGVQNRYDITPHKVSDKDSTLTYYDSNLSSPYCEVYCNESINANFDSNNPTVLAGSQFQWGWSSINTTRTCKTKSINWGSVTTAGSFLFDLNNANQAVVQAEAQQQLHNANKDKSWVADGTCTISEGTSSTTTGESFTCDTHVDAEGKRIPTAGDCDNIHNSGGYSGCSTEEISHNGNVHSFRYYNCSKTTYSGAVTGTLYKYSGAVTSKTITISGITKTATHDNFTRCLETSAAVPEDNPVSTGDVTGAINLVNSVVNNMKKCYDFVDSQVLNDSSTANISYTSPQNTYIYSGEMKASVSLSKSEIKCQSFNQNINAITCVSGDCSDSNKISLPNCSNYQESGTSSKSFMLQDDIYRYILKNPNGATVKSIHATDLGNYTSGSLTVNWVDVGYSNFPVPYYFSTQRYTGALKIEYSNLGHRASQFDSTIVDKILSVVDSTNYGNWSCNYTVEPDLIRDNDIDLIYREIDLNNPFPDINAGTRNTGANWCDNDDCSWNNGIVKNFILKNRNVQGDELYNLKPMYTFIMTPSDIIKIRKYNTANTYTSYTGIDGSEKYDFKCISGTGRGCRSGYLDKLMSIMDAKDYSGTCINDRTVPTNEQQFNSCRY